MTMKQVINNALGRVHIDAFGALNPGESKVLHELQVLGADIQDALRRGWITIIDFIEPEAEPVKPIEYITLPEPATATSAETSAEIAPVVAETQAPAAEPTPEVPAETPAA